MMNSKRHYLYFRKLILLNIIHMRPFKVLGIQQIAIGNESKTHLKKFWVDIMGLEKTGTFRSERENVDEDVLRIGIGPFSVEVDIMQPIDAEKTPKVHEPKLNHIGLWIDDLPKAVEWLTAQGVRFTPGGIRKGASGYDVCFIHPKSNDEFPICSEGVLVELVQAPVEVKKAMKLPAVS
jgi:lactoylglutathione lyase